MAILLTYSKTELLPHQDIISIVHECLNEEGGSVLQGLHSTQMEIMKSLSCHSDVSRDIVISCGSAKHGYACAAFEFEATGPPIGRQYGARRCCIQDKDAGAIV